MCWLAWGRGDNHTCINYAKYVHVWSDSEIRASLGRHYSADKYTSFKREGLPSVNHLWECIIVRHHHGNVLYFFPLGLGSHWVHLLRRPLFCFLYQPKMTDDDQCGAADRIIIGRRNQSTRRKPAPMRLLSITNLRWHELQLKPDPRGGEAWE
jgi:hypothetical protein